MKNILVCGIPRAGTTWIGKVLSYGEGVKYIHEPDNERQNLLAMVYKDELNRFPLLKAEQSCAPYEDLFSKAYTGGYIEPYGLPSEIIRKVFSVDMEEVEARIRTRSGYAEGGLKENGIRLKIREKLLETSVEAVSLLGRIKERLSPSADVTVVKSVHCQLALDFLNEKLSIDKTLVIYRHPASIIASHLRMGNKDIWRPILGDGRRVDESLKPYVGEVQNLNNRIARAGAKIGAVYYLLQQYREDEQFEFVRYEQVCREPVGEFRKLYKALGLEWGDDLEVYIRGLNREGEGYSIKRVAEEQINKWKEELTPSQVQSAREGYRIFPLELNYRFK